MGKLNWIQVKVYIKRKLDQNLKMKSESFVAASRPPHIKKKVQIKSFQSLVSHI